MRLVISRRLTLLLLAPLLLFSYSLLYSISLLSDHYSTASIIVMDFGKRKEEARLLSVKCLSEQLIGESQTDAGYNVCAADEIASQHSNCVCSLNDGGDISFEKELNEAIDERCRIRFYTPLKVVPTVMQLLEKPTVLHTPRYAYEAFSISMFEARVAIDGDLNTTTVLRREFRASGNPVKFPLLKVDMGDAGIRLLLSPRLGLLPCQVLVRLAGDPTHIEAFVRGMKLRQYLLYAVRKWIRRSGAGVESVDGPERPSETFYNLSFVRYHCADGARYQVAVE